MTDNISHGYKLANHFKRSQTFTVHKGACLEKPQSDRPRLKLVKCDSSTGVLDESLKPSWDALDRSVLRFFAYIEEADAPGSLQAPRVRAFVILYYLSDDTVSIFEPRVENSGMIQGPFLKRSRVPGFDVQAVRIGSCVSIHQHNFVVSDADKFTRDYFNSLGVCLGEAKSVPMDRFGQRNQHDDRYELPSYEPLGKSVHIDTKKVMRFLENDKKVCRFFAVQRSEQETRFFVLLYYLADNTVEIRESVQPNSGRDECSVFFNRGILDTNGRPAGPESTLIEVRNWRVGSSISLCSNEFWVYDADKFTRNWFAVKFGISLDPALSVEVKTKQTWKPCATETPPYTGFGSWEDSLGSVKSLCPKPPKKHPLPDGRLLRFRCRLESPTVEDKDRRFVFSFHSADKQLAIHEPSVRNSGIIGGKFLEKGLYINELTGEVLKEGDLKNGSTVRILGRSFLVEQSDALACREGSSLLPIANEVQRKLIQLMPQIHDTFRRFDKDATDLITVDKFRDILVQFGFNLSEEECLGIMQVFDSNHNGLISYQEFCDALSHEQLSLPEVAIKDYKERTRKTLESKSEHDMQIHAARKLTEILYSKNSLSQRLMKELGVLSNHSKIIDSSLFKRALDNLGISQSQNDIDRVVDLAKQQDESINAFDYFLFLRNITILYHNV